MIVVIFLGAMMARDSACWFFLQRLDAEIVRDGPVSWSAVPTWKISVTLLRNKQCGRLRAIIDLPRDFSSTKLKRTLFTQINGEPRSVSLRRNSRSSFPTWQPRCSSWESSITLAIKSASEFVTGCVWASCERTNGVLSQLDFPFQWPCSEQGKIEESRTIGDDSRAR